MLSAIDLSIIQAEHEWEAHALGKARFFENLQAQTDTASGKATIKNTLPMVAAAITAFVERASAPRAGRRHVALPYLLHILPEQAAYLALCHTLNHAAEGTGRTLSSLAITIGTAVEDHINLVGLSDEAPGLYRKVMEQVKKSTTERHRSGVLRHVVEKYRKEALTWTKEDKVILGTKLVELVAEATELVEKVNIKRNGTTRAVIQLTERAATFFENANNAEACWHPVHYPMVVPPRPWTTPVTGGYTTKAMRRARMVQTFLPGALDEIENRDMPAVYDAINTIQSTAWRINKSLLAVMREVQEAGEGLAYLISEDTLPIPLRPTSVPPDVPTAKLSVSQKEDLTVWKKAAAEVYEHNARVRSKRVSASQKLHVASKFERFERIYFPHYVDFRGRVYPFANYLNPQADDLGRALLEFAEGKPLGERGLYWLKVHVANLYGVDKVSFEERVKWVDDNFDALYDSATRPLDGRMKWTEADSPWCALAACMELVGAVVQGPDYVSRIPIAMDGSCSGLQHYSAMLRDPVGGAAVNLVPQEKPGDIYTKVAKRAQSIVDESDEPQAQPWKSGKVVRKVAKQPTMTLCYSATVFGMQGQIEKAVRELGGEAYLGGEELRPLCIYMAGVIWDAIGDTVVAARDAMAFLKEVSKVVSATGLPVKWTSPVGFPVTQAYNEPVAQRVRVHYAGSLMDLYFQKEGSKLDARRQASGIAPNFVHSLDAAHLMSSVNLGVENGLTDWAVIHDSFGCHAADVDMLNACIREAFIEQYTPDVLARFRDEIAASLDPEQAADLPALPSKGSLDLDAVRDSRYFFA